MVNPDDAAAIWIPVVFIFLGWLLGMLGPIIVDSIKKRYRNVEVRKTVLAELSGARFRLVATTYALDSRYVGFDRALVEWAIPYLKSYKGPGQSEKLVASLQKQLLMTDDQFKLVATHRMAEDGGASAVKKFKIPYIESKLTDLGIFDEETQLAILEIRNHAEIYNEHVDEHKFYFNLTFSNVSEENYAIASKGVSNCYGHLSARARIIIGRIDNLVPTER